nr:glycerophosphodiester phosphodiesterase [Lysobacter pythonis]
MPAANAAAETRMPAAKPMVIAHRGASALRPEHTLAAYRLAIEHGADAIEPDLVMTRDGVLVARHENEISGTTDVAAHPEFSTRKTRKRIDGQWVEGWFSEDFTLAELKTLRARERLLQLRSTAFDGQFPIATLPEIIELAAAESARLGRDIALVPEIKHPSYFKGIGLAMEQPLIDTLDHHQYTRRAPVIIQSFETGNLRELRAKLGTRGNIRLLQLLDEAGAQPHDLVLAGENTRYADLMTPDGLRRIARYADAIGPWKGLLDLQRGKDGRWHSRLIDDAHAAGLDVIAYTFRPENHFLPEDHRDAKEATARNESGAMREIREYTEAGLDGLFADDPQLARRAIDNRP